MPKAIIWSPSSEQDHALIMKYLSENWEEKTSDKFLSILEEVLEKIAENPLLFPVINDEFQVRKCIDQTQHTLLSHYRIPHRIIENIRQQAGSPASSIWIGLLYFTIFDHSAISNPITL